MIRRTRATRRVPPRWSRPLLVAVAVIVVASFIGLSPSTAAAQGDCTPIDRGGTTCRIGDGGGGDPAPGTTTRSSSSPPGPTFKWLSLLVSCDAATASGWTPLSDLDSAIFDLAGGPGATAPAEPGFLRIGELIDPVSGGTNSGYLACVGVGQAPPPTPPPPPTAAEIWGAALTFEPQVHLDPYVRGLTGLETFVWYEGPTGDSLTLNLNGFTVQATIEAVEFTWDLGGPSRDGQQSYSSPVPGSADDPAADHTYAKPGEVVVIHRTRWIGSALLTGPGLPAGGITLDLGEAVLATARAYDVIEVRTPVVRG